MSKFERVKQWAAYARTWHIYDAKWQNPFHSAKVLLSSRPTVRLSVRLSSSPPLLLASSPLFLFHFFSFYYAPRPAERSEAGRGAFYFSAHSDSYQVTTG